MKFRKFLLKYYFRLPVDTIVPLGGVEQRGTIFAAVYFEPLWRKISFWSKVRAILTFTWTPQNDVVLGEAKKVLMRDIFGNKDDFGDELFMIHAWCGGLTWNFDNLTSNDDQKIKALQGTRLLTGLLHLDATSPHLHLSLPLYNLPMCLLVFPMVAKTPIISLRYCLELSEDHTFNSIRGSGHPKADELIAYLYDTLFIQQKIATSLHEFYRLVSVIQEKKEESVLIKAEIDAIEKADSIISYLKATVEKLLVLLGLTFDISNLENHKIHIKKLKAIESQLPLKAKEATYFEFIWKYMQSEELQKLNNLRTGILHKMGIASLQPHTFMDRDTQGKPLLEIFDTLMDQHRKNTAMFLGVLALLTDDLVVRKPPDESFVTSFNQLMIHAFGANDIHINPEQL